MFLKNLCLVSVVALGAQAAFVHAGVPALKSDNPLHTSLDRAVEAQSDAFFASGCHVGLSLAAVRRAGRSHRLLVGNSEDGVAMAWHLGWVGHDPMLWHSGGSFGTSAQVVLFPKQEEGYVLLTNDACEGTESALREFALSVHGKLRSDL